MEPPIPFKKRTDQRVLRLALTALMTLEMLNYVVQHGPSVCLYSLPHGRHVELYAALVCGIPISASQEKQLFLDSGLIHILVVSGAHLLFLESLLYWLPLRWRIAALGFYCWLTGFGAPVLKAFLRRIVECWLRPKGFSGLQMEAGAVLATLCFCPAWIFSRSLQMSWMCALAMQLPRWLAWAAADQALKAYVLLFVFCGSPVVTVAWNTLLAPLVGFVLFPLCLVAVVLPFVVPLVDGCWDVFLFLLRLGPKSDPQAWFLTAKDLFWLPPLLHLALLVREVRWRRARAFLLSP